MRGCAWPPTASCEIAGSLFSGYLGDPTPVPEWWPTGDLGRIDDDGFVHVLGRKKHVLITSFGRNVSPEWVETALRSQPAVRQAVVFGDGQPALSRRAVAGAAPARRRRAAGRRRRRQCQRCPTTPASAAGRAAAPPSAPAPAWPPPTAGRSAQPSGSAHADALDTASTLESTST